MQIASLIVTLFRGECGECSQRDFSSTRAVGGLNPSTGPATNNIRWPNAMLCRFYHSPQHKTTLSTARKSRDLQNGAAEQQQQKKTRDACIQQFVSGCCVCRIR